MKTTIRTTARPLAGLAALAVFVAVPAALMGCEDKSSSKTTTTTKTETPSGTTKTTETHEKKVETDKK